MNLGRINFETVSSYLDSFTRRRTRSIELLGSQIRLYRISVGCFPNGLKSSRIGSWNRNWMSSMQKIKYWALWALLLLPSLAMAQLAAVPIKGAAQYSLQPTTVTPLTVPSGANYAALCTIGQIYYTTDGTVPSAVVTQLTDQCMPIYGHATLVAFQMIGSGTVSIQYFKE
jgi:hypothetical protein